ncbi:arabinan endo-1,5-alpha-L-arabinosidase, partial [bacterium]
MNPVLPGWHADPELHLFAGRYWIYPTYSDLYEKQTFFPAFSSSDLVTWRDEGRMLDFADVPWSTNRAAWAPTVAEHEGVYRMVFSAGDGAGLGVARSDLPGGPFVDALGKPLISEYHHGAQPIDAHLFEDDDGRAYLYYGGWRHAVVVEMGEDRESTIGEFREITPENYVEGPFMVKRNGTYYLMWSEGSWGDATYNVAYGRSDSPLGPFPREGALFLPNPEIGSSAGHHSVLGLPNDEWIICYHRRPAEQTGRDHRVTCLETMHFDADGRIL